MRSLFVLVFIAAVVVGNAVAYAGEFGTPTSPQPITVNGAYAHFDVQVHNRDRLGTWDQPMAAQHGTDCSAPPATHTVSNLRDAVFVCASHVMTAAWAEGYGEIVLTPSQVLDCTVSCSVSFDISTERQSLRDWWELRLTPWADNLALPICGCLQEVDLQGFPRNGIDVSINNGESRPLTSVVNNGVATDIFQQEPAAFNKDITAGTNQAAVRQTFKLTVTPGRVKFERLVSATAVGIVFLDASAPVQMRNDYIVQFEHHSYNPTKDGAGVAATWHWSNFTLTPSTPFTLIHATPMLVTANNRLVTFDSPAPANAFLRFSAICRVLVDGVLAPRQAFLGHPEHASSYFIPIAQGKTSVNIAFMADDWFSGPCYAQDFHVWSKGGAQLTPTPTSSPGPTTVPATSTPSATPTSNPTATATATIPVPSPTATSTAVLPTATPTPNAQTQVCTKRWGNQTIRNYGQMTLAQCLAVGP